MQAPDRYIMHAQVGIHVDRRSHVDTQTTKGGHCRLIIRVLKYAENCRQVNMIGGRYTLTFNTLGGNVSLEQ